VEEYVESTCRPYLMDVIYCWSRVSEIEALLLDFFFKKNAFGSFVGLRNILISSCVLVLTMSNL
jgi:hypothetical protein